MKLPIDNVLDCKGLGLVTQSLCDVYLYEENGMSGLNQANMHYDKSQPWNIELLKEGQDSVVSVSYIY